MKHLKPLRFVPRLEALEDRWCPSSTIQDFLSQQGHTSVFNFGVSGMPDEIGWASSTSTVISGNGRFARVDYTGQDAAFLGLNLGTTTSGTVSERSLSDGRAEVTVNLHTHNAFAWATQLLPDGSYGALLFGYTPMQLQANPSLTPPLANSDLQLVAKIPAPGSPLPDIVNDFILGNAPAGEELVSLSFRATAQGSTPAGQQATLIVSQTGVLGRTPNLIRDFGFTAEVVDIQTHASAAPTMATTSAAVPTTAAGSAISAAPAPSSPPHASQLRPIDGLATFWDDPLAWELGADLQMNDIA
jgi:hypothetical protein